MKIKSRWILLLCLSVFVADTATALMAGDTKSFPTDSPSKRVDPNRAESPWAGVGSLSVNGGTYSGVLIGPHQVLTAAHVVSGRAAADITFNLNDREITPHPIGVSAVYVHPGYGAKSFQGIVLNDLAVLQLDEDVPAQIPKYDLLGAPLKPGTILTLVGYGASGDGVHGVTVPANSSVKRVGKNVLDVYIKSSPAVALPEVYLFDFDSPAAFNALGGGSLGNDVETMLAGGDSGSPAFVMQNGRWIVAGINTFQQSLPEKNITAPQFGSIGGGMFIPTYRQWIQSADKTSQQDTTMPIYIWSGLSGLAGLAWVRHHHKTA